jgi:hypothetical protein
MRLPRLEVESLREKQKKSVFLEGRKSGVVFELTWEERLNIKGAE